MREKQVHPFQAVIDSKTKILILGSFPSVISRKEHFYYMNKNNRFFKVLSAIYQEDFYHAPIEKKISLLHKYHLGLFDVISSCSIKGSSDTSIVDVTVNDIEALLKESMVEKIICNGKKAYTLFLNYFPHLAKLGVYCPSTSSANASFSLNDLIKIYRNELL